MPDDFDPNVGVLAQGAEGTQDGADAALLVQLNRISDKLVSDDEAEAAAQPFGATRGDATERDADDVDATDEAKARAEALGVDIRTVQGTGADGRVLVSDVEAAAGGD